ncbi:MAG TPA: cell division protein CrgA [Actinomycetota bacterium]|jgi:hypothetical protein|nr:cell division protein CrgA [Actinomycetota bacterium]
MPESRSRQKQRQRRRPYVPQAQPKRRKASPRWFGVVVLGVMAVGVGLIIWNYFRGDQAQNLYLWIGLGLIGTGFGLATQWR